MAFKMRGFSPFTFEGKKKKKNKKELDGHERHTAPPKNPFDTPNVSIFDPSNKKIETPIDRDIIPRKTKTKVSVKTPAHIKVKKDVQLRKSLFNFPGRKI